MNDAELKTHSYRLRPDQINALRRIALERAERDGGRATSSGVLREILDEYLAWRAEQAKAAAGG